MEFHYVDLRAFCYATEDEERVVDSLELFLPPEIGPDEETPEEFIERSVTEGHYGDEIIVLEARLERADEIRYVMDKVLELDNIDKIEDELEQRVNPNCAFHIRLDKQAAYKGDVEMGDGITLRAKVEAYPAKHEKAVEAVRRSLFEA